MTPSGLDTALTRDAGIAVPLIGGAMFPCSNPELVAAVSEAGGEPMLRGHVGGKVRHGPGMPEQPLRQS